MLKKLLVSLLVSFGFLLIAAPAFAASPLSGYAWSSTIGWVSFNSSDGATVSLATTSSSGTLSGYAWSPNIGWIEFGGLAGSTVGGQTTTDATVNMSTGAVSGWARAVSAVSRTDGWDGWIELSGTNHQTGDTQGNNGVTFVPSTGQFIGYAWGGSVVGWLQFYNVKVGTTPCQSGDPNCPPPPPPPPNGCSGSCPVISSCNLNLPVGPYTSPYTLSLAGASVGVSDGTAPYTYLWSVGPVGNFSSQTTYSGLTSGTYPVSVEAQDKTGATSNMYSCGTVTVSGSGLSVPELWPGSSQTPPANVDFSTNPTLTMHILVGNSATVSFAWSTSLFSGCLGAVTLPNNWPSQSSPNNTWLSSLLGNGNGSFTFTNMSSGIYKIYIECISISNNQSNTGKTSFMAALENLFAQAPPTITYVPSNPVEIDVTPSSVQEI